MGNRPGNTLFFLSLVLLTLAAIVLSMGEEGVRPIAFTIGGLALVMVVISIWQWGRRGASPPSELSSLPPKLKLLGGIGGLALVLIPADPANKPQQFLGLALIAVAIVGAVEMLIDRKFPSLKGKWDGMRPWKKSVGSMLVLVLAFMIFGAIAMLIANWIYLR